MSWKDKPTREDVKRARKLGILKGPAKSWTLVFSFGGKDEPIAGMSEKARGLCEWKKKQIKDEPQYRGGSLTIKPNY